MKNSTIPDDDFDKINFHINHWVIPQKKSKLEIWKGIKAKAFPQNNKSNFASK